MMHRTTTHATKNTTQALRIQIRAVRLSGLLAAALLSASLVTHAQEPAPSATPSTEPARHAPPVVRVQVESGVIRSAPCQSAGTVIGSVFLDDPLELIGRSADGTWYNVRRPGRTTSLGWASSEILADRGVQAESLPLKDSSACISGPNPVTDTSLAVFTLSEIVMRDGPLLTANPTGITVPQSVTVQVVARNQNATWLYVNHDGYLGWVAGFLVREREDLLRAPQAPNLPPLPGGDLFIVPPELQLAEVQRLRDYLNANIAFSDALAAFWFSVSQGDILSCDAPPRREQFLYSDANARTLPELDRIVPRLNTATGFINDSIAPLEDCGVVTRQQAVAARGAAINARLILENGLRNADEVERIILSQVDK